MTIATRTQAAANARASKTNIPAFCQGWTRGLYLAPSAGDQDHDGDADAVDGWLSEPAKYRHTDRKPPLGTPVAWSGGSNGNGHRAISLGPDEDGVYQIRSTDAGGSGKVATVPLAWFEQHWGLKYLGWNESISGLLIEDDTKPAAVAKPKLKPLTPEQRARVIRRAARRARIAGHAKWADRLLVWATTITRRAKK